MFKLVTILILKLFIISIIQSQTYYECKFESDISPCRLIPVQNAPDLRVESSVYLSDPFIDPVLPLSDVSSIITEYSNNRLYCKLPYQLNGNSTNLYFCSKLGNSPNLPSCIKTDDTIQECVLGKYVQLQLTSTEKNTYYIEVTGAASSSCLSFYYYITQPNAAEIVVWSNDFISNTVQQIGKAFEVPYNGWHRIEFSFNPYVDKYRVYFDLQRLDYSNNSLFVALDEILIVNGLCDIKDDNTSISFDIQESMTEETSNTTTTLSTSTQSVTTSTTTEELTSETSDTSTTISYSTDLSTSDIENLTTTAIISSTTITPLQSTTTTTGDAAATTAPPSNLNLILTLSISSAIALILIFIVIIYYRVKVKRRIHRISGYNYEKYFPMQSPLDQCNDNDGFEDE